MFWLIKTRESEKPRTWFNENETLEQETWQPASPFKADLEQATLAEAIDFLWILTDLPTTPRPIQLWPSLKGSRRASSSGTLYRQRTSSRHSAAWCSTGPWVFHEFSRVLQCFHHVFQHWAFAFLWDMSFYIPCIFSGIPHRSLAFFVEICMNDAHVFSRNGTTVRSIHPGDWLRNLKNWNSPNSTKSTEVSPKSHGNHMEITRFDEIWGAWSGGLGPNPTCTQLRMEWRGCPVPCARCLKFGVQHFKVSVTRQLHRFASFCGSRVRELGAPRLQISNLSALLTLALVSHIVCQKA